VLKIILAYPGRCNGQGGSLICWFCKLADRFKKRATFRPPGNNPKGFLTKENGSNPIRKASALMRASSSHRAERRIVWEMIRVSGPEGGEHERKPSRVAQLRHRLPHDDKTDLTQQGVFRVAL